MSGLYDPESMAEGFATFRAWRMHRETCADPTPMRCAEYLRLDDAVRVAVQRRLTPYRIVFDGGERGAWTEGTARTTAQFHGGTITRIPIEGPTGGSGRMIKHTENIADVEQVWLTEDAEGKWLHVGVVTAGGLSKTLRMPESAARWLRASVIDAMRRTIAEDE